MGAANPGAAGTGGGMGAEVGVLLAGADSGAESGLGAQAGALTAMAADIEAGPRMGFEAGV